MATKRDDERVKSLVFAGSSTWDDLARAYGVARSTLRSWYPDAKSPEDIVTITPGYDRLLALVRSGPADFYSLCDSLDASPSDVHKMVASARDAGINLVYEERQETIYLPQTPASRPIAPLSRSDKIGCMSDTHFGSKHCQITHMHDFVGRAYDSGVRHMFVAGDVTAGQNVYRGQIYDVHCVGADEQVDFAAENLPQHEDLTYYMIGGNHDYSHYKSGGVDVVRKLSELRSDVVALGFDQQDVQFGNWTIRLIHPSGGAPYARSYRAQKLAEGAMIGELWESVRESADEAIATSSVPMLLVWGHLHYVDITPYGPIFTLGPGCFEGQTNYLVTKGLIPSIGGFVVDVPEELDPVCRLKYEHFQYQEIPDDYLSYASTIKTRRILKVK